MSTYGVTDSLAVRLGAKLMPKWQLARGRNQQGSCHGPLVYKEL